MAKRKIFATAEEIARTIVDNGLTVRQAADRFGCGRSSIQNYVNTLAETNPELYAQVKEIYKRNRSTKPATICESGKSTITVTKKSEAPATGHRIGGNAHPVICIETGETYSSVTDAAEVIGVTPSTISQIFMGNVKTCKGMHFIKVADAKENVGLLTNAIKSANAKAEAAEAKAKAAEEEKEDKIAAVLETTAEQIQAAHIIAQNLNDARQAAENKYNALAEKLAAVATFDKEIAELKQRLAEAEANREIAYNNLFK